MTTRKSLAISVWLLCALGVSAQGAVVYTTGFEPGTYTVGPLNGKDGWTVVQSGGGSVNVQSSVKFTGSQATHITRGSGTAPHGVLRAPVLNVDDKIVSIEGYARVQPSSSPSLWTVIEAVLADGPFMTSLRVNVLTSGQISVHDGAVPNFTAKVVTKDQWHHYQLVLDMNTRTLRVYVDGPEVYTGQFGGTGNTLNQIAFYGSGIANDNAYFDDYSIRVLGSSGVGIYNSGIWRLDSNENLAADDPFFVFDAGPGSRRITGDWNGDGRDQIGLFKDGFWFLDFNGNGVWDGTPLDRQYQFGFAGVTPFVGDWNGNGTDKIGFFIDGYWYLDLDGNGLWGGPALDIAAQFGWSGVTPLVADWNGDGSDNIGIYVNGFWFVDYDGNAVWDGSAIDRSAEFGFPGVTPITGDWDGDGTESIGIYINGFWYLDTNGSFVWDGPGTDSQAHFGFTGVTPLVGDWNGDGADKIGIFYDGFFYQDFDGSLAYDSGVVDKGFVYGGLGDLPVTGSW